MKKTKKMKQNTNANEIQKNRKYEKTVEKQIVKKKWGRVKIIFQKNV